jgi:ubiquinone/menaquinone biosynthesis C-methylase UbiE
LSERLRAVFRELDIQPDDRSQKMFDAATVRNAAHVEAGRAEFLVASLEDMDLGERRFDKVFAVRVGFYDSPG